MTRAWICIGRTGSKPWVGGTFAVDNALQNLPIIPAVCAVGRLCRVLVDHREIDDSMSFSDKFAYALDWLAEPS